MLQAPVSAWCIYFKDFTCLVSWGGYNFDKYCSWLDGTISNINIKHKKRWVVFKLRYKVKRQRLRWNGKMFYLDRLIKYTIFLPKNTNEQRNKRRTNPKQGNLLFSSSNLYWKVTVTGGECTPVLKCYKNLPSSEAPQFPLGSPRFSCNEKISLRSWRYCVGARLKFWRRSRVPKKGSRDEAVEKKI